MDGLSKKTEIPAAAFNFRQGGAVTFSDASNKNRIRLLLYNGTVTMGHWYWGNIAFDLKGMRLAKPKVPILQEHRDRVGFSTSHKINGQFILEGKFLKNPTAQELRADMQQGFPMQASLRFSPEKSEIEHITEGESVQVNGHTLPGPGTLVRKTVIVEGSLCTFGALNGTESAAFDKGQAHTKKNPAAKKTEDFWAAVDRRAKKESCSKADAVRFCVKEFPELYGEMLVNYGV